MPDQEPNQDADNPSPMDADESDEEQSPEPNVAPSLASEDPSADSDADTDAEAPSDSDELRFDDENLGEELRHLSEEELDDAPFGIIRVDDDGVVEFFNEYESDLSGMDPDDVHGRNFFTQVAPCTNNRLFRGRFKKGIRRGKLDETFTYTYTYKMRPTLVEVHMYRDEESNNWITVKKY